MHKYTSSIDYIDSLKFDYVETYSFQRGTEYENFIRTAKPEYDKLKVRNEKRRNLTPVEKIRFEELHSLFGFTQYILNEKGQFHLSGIRTNTFKSSDQKIETLKEILRTEIKEIPNWICAPIYRDAFIFYNEAGQIVSTLNVCLSCEHMEVKALEHIDADGTAYKVLMQFFTDIGHTIEDNEMKALR